MHDPSKASPTPTATSLVYDEGAANGRATQERDSEEGRPVPVLTIHQDRPGRDLERTPDSRVDSACLFLSRAPKAFLMGNWLALPGPSGVRRTSERRLDRGGRVGRKEETTAGLRVEDVVVIMRWVMGVVGGR